MRGMLVLVLVCFCLLPAGCILWSLVPSGRELHFFSGPGSIGFYYSPPTLVGGYVYVGTGRGFHHDVADNNRFYKLDLKLGKVWEYPLGKNEVRGGAALDDAGNVYFVVHEGREAGVARSGVLFLYSLDNSGRFRWSRAIDSSPHELGMSNPAIAADNTIYVGGDRFYAFDSDGNVKWAWGSGLNVMNAPIIDRHGNVYFNACGAVVSLGRNGNERWQSAASGEWFSSPAFSVDFSRVFAAVGDTVFCFDAVSGARVWGFAPAGIVGAFRATPAVDDHDNVYIGTKADKSSVFYAIRADGSGLLWKRDVGADLYSSPALGDDRTVYVGSEISDARGTRLHAFDMATGDTKWSSSLRADVTWSSPAISDEGVLYIASMGFAGSDGGVYAFRTDSKGLLPNAGSPRFHGGNASTGRRK